MELTGDEVEFHGDADRRGCRRRGDRGGDSLIAASIAAWSRGR